MDGRLFNSDDRRMHNAGGPVTHREGKIGEPLLHPSFPSLHQKSTASCVPLLLLLLTKVKQNKLWIKNTDTHRTAVRRLSITGGAITKPQWDSEVRQMLLESSATCTYHTSAG